MQRNTSIQTERIEKIRNLNFRNLKLTLHLFASTSIVHCLCLLIHEMGHAISYWLAGYKVWFIDVHPFALSQCIPGNQAVHGLFQALMGPLFNVTVGTIVFLSLWKFRRPQLLPFLLYGAFVYLEEGVGIIIDVIEYPQSIGDWGEAIRDGLPEPVTAIIGGLFIANGMFMFSLLYPIMGVSSKTSYIKKTLITQGGVSMLFLVSYLYSLKFFISLRSARLIALIGCFSLIQVIVTLHPLLYKPLNKLISTEPSEANWVQTGITLGIALTVMLILILTYHWNISFPDLP